MSQTKICRVFVDLSRCKACGACVEICPEIFRFNEATEKAEEKVDRAPLSDALEQAVSICPTKCIELSC